jgi:hypothetical protein
VITQGFPAYFAPPWRFHIFQHVPHFTRVNCLRDATVLLSAFARPGDAAASINKTFENGEEFLERIDLSARADGDVRRATPPVRADIGWITRLDTRS